ncbi:MAG: hypothetical protein ACR2K1_08480 [Saprospiraceae bacterium]
MFAFLDAAKQQYHKARQQQRLAIIKGELQTAQEDCAALGIYIGRLIQRKTELETEINRETT